VTNDEAESMLKELAKHFGEPVLPLERFCHAMTTWSELAKADLPILSIKKSNLLYRMIYLGEEPRDVPCPLHRGKWSGCKEPGYCACQKPDECNVTGWLPHGMKAEEFVMSEAAKRHEEIVRRIQERVL